MQVSWIPQGVVTPATVVTACSAALSPLYNWLLVDYFEVGLAGAALANDAVQVTTFATAFPNPNANPPLVTYFALPLHELDNSCFAAIWVVDLQMCHSTSPRDSTRELRVLPALISTRLICMQRGM